jgi:hypothetical protein
MIAGISGRLAALAEAGDRRPAVGSLRGVRGVPSGDVARTAAAAWREGPAMLPRDAEALDRLFGSAFEDGLVAIGLLSAAIEGDPGVAHELGLAWAERTDDVLTADALGWLVLAQTVALGADLGATLDALAGHGRPETRRVGVTIGMGFTPTIVEGPAAAPLREKLGERHIRLVGAADDVRIGAIAHRFLRDEAPPVRKALRRLLSAWGASHPAGMAGWARGVRGGLPKLLREVVGG